MRWLIELVQKKLMLQYRSKWIEKLFANTIVQQLHDLNIHYGSLVIIVYSLPRLISIFSSQSSTSEGVENKASGSSFDDFLLYSQVVFACITLIFGRVYTQVRLVLIYVQCALCLYEQSRQASSLTNEGQATQVGVTVGLYLCVAPSGQHFNFFICNLMFLAMMLLTMPAVLSQREETSTIWVIVGLFGLQMRFFVDERQKRLLFHSEESYESSSSLPGTGNGAGIGIGIVPGIGDASKNMRNQDKSLIGGVGKNDYDRYSANLGASPSSKVWQLKRVTEETIGAAAAEQAQLHLMNNPMSPLSPASFSGLQNNLFANEGQLLRNHGDESGQADNNNNSNTAGFFSAKFPTKRLAGNAFVPAGGVSIGNSQQQQQQQQQQGQVDILNGAHIAMMKRGLEMSPASKFQPFVRDSGSNGNFVGNKQKMQSSQSSSSGVKKSKINASRSGSVFAIERGMAEVREQLNMLQLQFQQLMPLRIGQQQQMQQSQQQQQQQQQSQLGMTISLANSNFFTNNNNNNNNNIDLNSNSGNCFMGLNPFFAKNLGPSISHIDLNERINFNERYLIDHLPFAWIHGKLDSRYERNYFVAANERARINYGVNDSITLNAFLSSCMVKSFISKIPTNRTSLADLISMKLAQNHRQRAASGTNSIKLNKKTRGRGDSVGMGGLSGSAAPLWQNGNGGVTQSTSVSMGSRVVEMWVEYAPGGVEWMTKLVILNDEEYMVIVNDDNVEKFMLESKKHAVCLDLIAQVERISARVSALSEQIAEGEVTRKDMFFENFLLVNYLLNVSLHLRVRLEMPLDLNQKSFTVASILQKTKQLIERDFKMNRVSILIGDSSASSQQALALEIVNDNFYLGHVLVNLVENAYENTSDGFVQILVRQSSRFPDHIRFDIIDSGEGIPAKIVQRINEGEFDEDGVNLPLVSGLSEKEEKQLSGFGFLFSHHLIKVLGPYRRIFAESIAGVGTRVSFVVYKDGIPPMHNTAAVEDSNQMLENFEEEMNVSGFTAVMMMQQQQQQNGQTNPTIQTIRGGNGTSPEIQVQSQQQIVQSQIVVMLREYIQLVGAEEDAVRKRAMMSAMMTESQENNNRMSTVTTKEIQSIGQRNKRGSMGFSSSNKGMTRGQSSRSSLSQISGYLHLRNSENNKQGSMTFTDPRQRFYAAQQNTESANTIKSDRLLQDLDLCLASSAANGNFGGIIVGNGVNSNNVGSEQMSSQQSIEIRIPSALSNKAGGVGHFGTDAGNGGGGGVGGNTVGFDEFNQWKSENYGERQKVPTIGGAAATVGAGTGTGTDSKNYFNFSVRDATQDSAAIAIGGLTAERESEMMNRSSEYDNLSSFKERAQLQQQILSMQQQSQSVVGYMGRRSSQLQIPNFSVNAQMKQLGGSVGAAGLAGGPGGDMKGARRWSKSIEETNQSVVINFDQSSKSNYNLNNNSNFINGNNNMILNLNINNNNNSNINGSNVNNNNNNQTSIIGVSQNEELLDEFRNSRIAIHNADRSYANSYRQNESDSSLYSSIVLEEEGVQKINGSVRRILRISSKQQQSSSTNDQENEITQLLAENAIRVKQGSRS